MSSHRNTTKGSFMSSHAHSSQKQTLINPPSSDTPCLILPSLSLIFLRRFCLTFLVFCFSDLISIVSFLFYFQDTVIQENYLERINWTQRCPDVFYHFLALLFYFAAFVLEAATTAANGGAHINSLPNSTDSVLCITFPRGNIFTVLSYREYSINVAATIFAFVVTLCYCGSMVMGFKRWRK
uniref:Mal, T cell differentiation protein 2 n=1 Tax=Poecilia reticulata TaxID=8081 RepID=A0A3P9P1N5_POERE